MCKNIRGHDLIKIWSQHNIPINKTKKDSWQGIGHNKYSLWLDIECKYYILYLQAIQKNLTPFGPKYPLNNLGDIVIKKHLKSILTSILNKLYFVGSPSLDIVNSV